MTKTSTDPAMLAVWVSMADHFLDTETRHDLPLTALRCVEAGLTPVQAREVWQHDVSPAVGFNLFDIAGEWAGWDEEWLVARIAEARQSRWHGPGRWRKLRLPMPLMGGQWLAIERIIEFLRAMPDASAQKRAAADLTFLARHLFDFCSTDLSNLASEDRERVRALYPAPFDSLLGSALQTQERAAATLRLQQALAGGAQ